MAQDSQGFFGRFHAGLLTRFLSTEEGSRGNGTEGGLPPNTRLHLSITTSPSVPNVPMPNGQQAQQTIQTTHVDDEQEPSMGADVDTARAHSVQGREQYGSMYGRERSSDNPNTGDVDVRPTTHIWGTGVRLEELENGVPRRGTHFELQQQETLNSGSEVASEAQNYRQGNTISSIDVRQVARSLEAALPFAVLVLVVFITHHLKAILLVSAGTFVLHETNKFIAKHINRNSSVPPFWKLLFCTSLALCTAALLGYFGQTKEEIKGTILFRYGQRKGTDEDNPMLLHDFWSVLFNIFLIDTMLRLFLAAINSTAIAILPAGNSTQRRVRGGILTAIAYAADVLRVAAPAPFWLRYFTSSAVPIIFSWLLCGIYLLLKSFKVMEKTSICYLALKQWRGMVYGLPARKDEIAADPVCAICHEEMDSLPGDGIGRNSNNEDCPLRLSCGHIFHESCISEWLVREATCPICRKVVRQESLSPRNDGIVSLLPSIC